MSVSVKEELTFQDVFVITKRWIRFFISKWLVILGCAIFSASIGLALAIKSEFTYTATLSFVLEDDRASGGISGAMGLASQLGVDLGGGGGSLGGMFNAINLLELMKSRTLIEKTLLTNVKRGDVSRSLADIYIDIYKWKQRLNDNPATRNIGAFTGHTSNDLTTIQDSIISQIHKEMLKGAILISPRDKRSGIIDVKVKSPNEFFSKEFVEVLVNVVSSFYVETKTKKALANVNILQKQSDSIRTQLNNAIGGVAQTNDATYNLNPAMSMSRLPLQKRQIDITANTAILTELVKNLELAKIALRKDTPLIQVVDYPVLPLEKDKLSKRKGVVLGFIIGAFLGIIYLTGFRLYKHL